MGAHKMDRQLVLLGVIFTLLSLTHGAPWTGAVDLSDCDPAKCPPKPPTEGEYGEEEPGVIIIITCNTQDTNLFFINNTPMKCGTGEVCDPDIAADPSSGNPCRPGPSTEAPGYP